MLSSRCLAAGAFSALLLLGAGCGTSGPYSHPHGRPYTQINPYGIHGGDPYLHHWHRLHHTHTLRHSTISLHKKTRGLRHCSH